MDLSLFIMKTSFTLMDSLYRRLIEARLKILKFSIFLLESLP